MKRTTIMADEAILERLRAIARDRGISFAEVAREALAEKAGSFRPRPKSLGVGDSGRRAISRSAGVGRTPSR